MSVVTQNYLVEVNNEHVIRGNSAVIKCSIPSFVADFVSVLSWNDNTGNEYAIHHDNTRGIYIYTFFLSGKFGYILYIYFLSYCI